MTVSTPQPQFGLEPRDVLFTETERLTLGTLSARCWCVSVTGPRSVQLKDLYNCGADPSGRLCGGITLKKKHHSNPDSLSEAALLSCHVVDP